MWQDVFALVVNDAKTDGTFLEIGGAQPFIGNNTWLLEKGYNWRGLSIELDHDLCAMWESQRPNTKLFEADAVAVNGGSGIIQSIMLLDEDDEELIAVAPERRAKDVEEGHVDDYREDRRDVAL